MPSIEKCFLLCTRLSHIDNSRLLLLRVGFFTRLIKGANFRQSFARNHNQTDTFRWYSGRDRSLSFDSALVPLAGVNGHPMGSIRVIMFPKLLLICSILSVSLVCRANEQCVNSENPHRITQWEPRSPEQTLYAYVRCLNDSTASIAKKISWVRWEPDASEQSQCYIKCVCEELRLYDKKLYKFYPERFVRQAEYFYGKDAEQVAPLRADAEPMLSGILKENTCEEVHSKYIAFYNRHVNTILRMFHGDDRDIKKTYKRLGDKVKQIGQPFIDFCEKLHDATWSDNISCPPVNLLDCVLRGFRWINEENEIDTTEIGRDYDASGYPDNTDLCQKAPPSARELYACLRAKNAKKLNKVIRERNLRSAFYFNITSQEEPWKSAMEFSSQLT
ncbi:37 kDa salivary gland allergen Aed a 2-like [Toxorhynchites rutilus septentrionalis]|uniref:37 kDa salivary gland allergen Aed a 2-like n=1 Tax=Toxorhynchites rutilus septentrionalis TaxID=329112 RepID=UPI0024785863|nr:37 kDa salivary gland allergen Aed a 2-like [Toxorhynchites rutilus septentrionalis]